MVVDLPEPATGQLNRFYTQEFFQEVRRLLKEGGILSLGLPQTCYAAALLALTGIVLLL